MQTGPTFREQGLSALRQGDAATAARFLSDAVRTDDTDAEAWSALGVALCQLGRVNDGIPALQRAVSLRPAAAPLHFNLGRALELQGRSADALTSFQRTLECDPGHTGASEAVRRAGMRDAVSPAPTLGDFALTPSPPVVELTNPVPIVAAVPTASVFAPMRPAPPSPYPHGAQAPPLSGYGPPTVYSGPSVPPAGPRAKRSGLPTWGVVLVVGAGILVVGGSMVLILAAVLLPAVVRAREAADRVRQRQQQRAWPSSPGAYAPPRGFSTPPSTPTFRSGPQFRPTPMPDFPRTRITVPRPQQFEAPEPPRFTPPPIPEPPQFTPPSMPDMPSPRMRDPHFFPGRGPRFRFGPSGAAPSVPTNPGQPPTGVPSDIAPPITPGN